MKFFMHVIPYIDYSLYELFLIFCFWSFIGWCIEVVDMAYETGDYQNRGFLNMPICPIEGFGMIMVIIFFKEIKNTVIPLFIASTILCTAFELLVGLGMEKIFHARWWDYSHMKFNYKGYICLRNSLFFGGGCVLCVRVVELFVEKVINALPEKIGLAIVIIMAVLIAVDTVSSFSAALNLSRRIKRLDEISERLLTFSVKTGKRLAAGTLKVKNNVEYAAEQLQYTEENRDEQSEKLRNEFDRLLSERNTKTERLLKAFPRIDAGKYTNSLNLLRSNMSNGKSKKNTVLNDEDDNI
ncbi:MAG: putative ABC transporter permease [Ruminococcus sp.]|nr:putative ABC transporter permease [Ruminococcus sp.]